MRKMMNLFNYRKKQTAKIVFLAIAITTFLAGCNRTGEFDWSSRSVQIEKEVSPGNWMAVDSIKLSEQYTIDRMAIDGLVVGVEFALVSNKVLSSFYVTCDNSHVQIALTEDTSLQSWSQRFLCKGRLWRIGLIDTADAKFQQSAAPGEILPANLPK